LKLLLETLHGQNCSNVREPLGGHELDFIISLNSLHRFKLISRSLAKSTRSYIPI